uniref:Hyaluronan/mRNA-binding protein domain-containing protein n=1 Tax=Kalanchoe fedtschenkoi TaxID=63787 RepID=A0A7N0RCZ6_KALFE
MLEKEKTVDEGMQSGEQEAENVSKKKPADEPEEKEPEEKEMTLEEYEKVLEEKRKALLLNKPEERKVNVDKELQSMKQIANKKASEEVFAKLGADKEKRRESADKEEKHKKAVSITDFLKPAEGERSSYGGRGRGRGRGAPRGGFSSDGQSPRPAATLANIEDPGHFPALGSK